MKKDIIVTIDFGNTKAKLIVFDLTNKSILYNKTYLQKDNIDIDKICLEFNTKNIIYCSVIEDNFFSLYKEQYNIFRFKKKVYYTNIKYNTKNTLGEDRIAAYIGAISLYKPPFLIIDIGTCIKYDYIDCNGFFIGGNISPGIELRNKSLNTFTYSLPLVEISTNFTENLLGKSTKNAIANGIINGVLYEIEGYIKYFKKINNNLKIIFTKEVPLQIRNLNLDNILFEPNIVLFGLREYYIKKILK